MNSTLFVHLFFLIYHWRGQNLPLIFAASVGSYVMFIPWQSRNSKDIRANKIVQVKIIMWVILENNIWENYNLVSVSEEEKSTYEQPSIWSRILSISSQVSHDCLVFPNMSLLEEWL